MASVTDAKTIIDDALLALSDVGATRWATSELLEWLNCGQLEIATLVPNSNTASISKLLVAGTKQTAPSDSIRLIEFTRNMGSNGSSPGKAIRQIERKYLERYTPNWSTDTASAEVMHVMYDAEDNNTVFYCYPQQPVTPQYIEIIYSQIPATIPNATAGTKITIADYYKNALLDYVLYRALSKDGEYGNQDARAHGHYKMFSDAVGIKFQADTNANNTPEMKPK